MQLANFFAVVAIILILAPIPAHAYIGPGLGLGVIVTIVTVIGSIFIALFAFFWYPIKRYIKSRKQKNSTTKE